MRVTELPATPTYPEDLQGGEVLACDTSYGTVVSQINQALRGEGAVGFWEPARLVQGVLNYKIKHPNLVEDIPGMVVGATEVAVGIHAGTLSPKGFEPFIERVDRLPGLKRSRIGQRRDMISAKASDPALSRQAADGLYRHTFGDDALFITLGHGGITAGMLAYLHYAAKRKAESSTVYPVRFSRQKKDDTKPRLSEQETAYLQRIAADRTSVAIFDEDSGSGQTLDRAVRFFDELLGKDTIPVANSAGYDRQPLVGFTALQTVIAG